MQVIKPEWIPLQAQFATLALSERILRIQNELEGLKREINAQQPEAMGSASDSLQFILRKIQRYVEWTAPDLLPEHCVARSVRAEEAEILVNVGRFASRLSIQEALHSSDQAVAEIDQQLIQLSTVLDVDRANSTH